MRPPDGSAVRITDVFSAILVSLRPAQWAKNLFVLAPLVFAQRLLDPSALARAGLAFAAFCAAASALYLVNDISDREEDRRHPLKSRRPVAAGSLPVPAAAAAAVALALLAALASAGLGRHFLVLLGAYVALNLLYSAALKRFVILDVMAIAFGFLLRVASGGAAIAVELSSWLLLCTMFLALFLAFSKRRHELMLLQGQAAEQRAVLSHYSPAFLDQMINVVTASCVVAYALYAVAPETAQKFHGESLVYTVPFVLFGVFRYLYLMYQRPSARNPTEAILRDGPFLINMLLWSLAAIWAIYLS
jgi:4-hydroxybenzoate polyprenyltransferase